MSDEELNKLKQEKLDRYLRKKREEKIATSYRKKPKLSSKYKFTMKTRCNKCKRIFDDKWEGVPHEVICPYCNHKREAPVTEEELKIMFKMILQHTIGSDFVSSNINIKPKELKEYLKKEEGRKII